MTRTPTEHRLGSWFLKRVDANSVQACLFCWILCLGLLSGRCGVADDKRPAAKQPNVLLVLTDDQGWGDVQSHGNTELTTPWMDRLRSDGARFERFFVSPVCAPTRASVLTGRYHLRCGVHGVTRSHETMRAAEVTIAEHFLAAGYRTGCFGKWHNGAHYPHDPQGQGFEEFLGFCGGHWNNYFDATLEHNQSWQQTDGYMIDTLTDAAIDFIHAHADQPFLCYVAWNTPHSPFQVPDRYYEKFKARGLDERLACIYGMCENIDDNLGRLLHALDQLKLTKNTIVVFLSDNGPNTERYNGSMRGRKGSVHEGGVRVPCFIKWPEQIPANRQVKSIASHIDLLPTLAALAEIDLDESSDIDGVDLSRLLKQGEDEFADRLIYTHHFRRGGQVEPSPGSVRSQRYRAVNEGAGWELYDMQSDPHQQQNVGEQNPTELTKLLRAYDAWFAEVTAGGFRVIPIEIGHPEAPVVELPAHEAVLQPASGRGIGYSHPSGWANDWITDWTDPQASASWSIAVTQAGRYEIALHYAAGESDLGSTVTISAGGRAVSHAVAEAYPGPVVAGPDRGERYEVPERRWKTVVAGSLQLDDASKRIEVQAQLHDPATRFSLKGLQIRRTK